jgi:hypothetical protein
MHTLTDEIEELVFTLDLDVHTLDFGDWTLELTVGNGWSTAAWIAPNGHSTAVEVGDA